MIEQKNYSAAVITSKTTAVVSSYFHLNESTPLKFFHTLAGESERRLFSTPSIAFETIQEIFVYKIQ